MGRIRSAKNQCFLTTAKKICHFPPVFWSLTTVNQRHQTAPSRAKNKIILQISRPGFFFRFSREIRRVCFAPPTPACINNSFLCQRVMHLKLFRQKSCFLFLSHTRPTVAPCEVVVRIKRAYMENWNWAINYPTTLFCGSSQVHSSLMY